MPINALEKRDLPVQSTDPHGPNQPHAARFLAENDIRGQAAKIRERSPLRLLQTRTLTYTVGKAKV